MSSFFYAFSSIIDSGFVGFPYTSPILLLHRLHPPHSCEVWRHGDIDILLDHLSISKMPVVLLGIIASISSKFIPAIATLDATGVTILRLFISRICSIGIFLMIKKYYPVPSTRSDRYIHPRECSRA